MRKVLLVLLAFVLLTSSLGALTVAVAEEGSFNATGYPIVNEPITMRMMISLNAARGVPYEDNELFRYLAELTNIKWEFITVDSTAWKERLSLMWTSDDMPDMIYTSVGTTADVQKYLNMGKLLDIAPYMADYAPNAMKYLESNEMLRMAVYTPKGQVGGFFYGSMDVQEGSGQCPPEFLMVNRPWLDKLGLQMPTNAEELFTVLKAFKDGDANGNGIEDEVGLAINAWSAEYIRLVFPWFGIMSDKDYNCFLDGETMVYTPLTEEYYEALKFLNRMYNEGLIDSDYFTMESQDVVARGSAETLTYGAVLSSAAFSVVGADRAEQYELAPMFKAANGEEFWYTRAFPAGIGVAAITSSCKYPEAAVRWADTFFDESYNKLYWMGVEGEAYHYNEDGTWDWNYENVEDGTTNSVRAKYTLQAATGSGPSICPTDWFLLADKTEKLANDQRVQFSTDYFGKLRQPLPMMYYSEDNARRLAELAGDLKEYEKEMLAKFVVGEIDIDSGREAYEAQLKQMGAEEIASILQATYEDNIGA